MTYDVRAILEDQDSAAAALCSLAPMFEEMGQLAAVLRQASARRH